MFKMSFGKFKGYEINQIPNTYLEWCVRNFKDSEIRCIFKAELADRKFHGEYIRDENEIDYNELDMWDFDFINGG